MASPSTGPRRGPPLPSLLLVVLLAAGGALAPRAARAGGLGEPWEEGIEAGIERQERDRKQRQPDSLLREARLLAARPTDDAQRIVRLYLLARAYGIAGDAASATSTYLEVLRQAPRCYFAHHDLAMIALGTKPPDVARAEQHLRQALAIHPQYLMAQRKLARLLFQGQKLPEAAAMLRRIVDTDPADLQARFLLAQVLLAQERVEDAEREVAALVRREPNNPLFEELKGDVYMARGRFDDAKAVYRRLATADPGSPAPLSAYLRCLDRQRKATDQADFEGYVWALEGLLRLERDEARRAEIRAALDEVRRGQQAGAAPASEGPPSDEQLAVALPTLPDPQRLKALQYVYARDDPPSADLLRAVIRRLSPTAEPQPTARVFALRILGRFGGFGLVGLVRHSLADPAPEVRPIAADVLVDLARTGPAAHGAAVLVLGPLGLSEDRVLGAAARAGVTELARVALPEPEEATDEVRREAWRAWWTGPAAGEAKLQALERFPAVGDLVPEGVLAPYLVDADPHVRLAAWRAVAEAAPPTLSAGDAPRRAWLEALPPAPGSDATAAEVEAAFGRLEAWLAARPR